MSRLTRDVDLGGIVPADLQQGAFDREKLRVLFNQLEFRLLLPRILDAVGDVAETPDADTLEVDVVIARDADGRRRRAARRGRPADRVAIEARWAGAPGRSDVVGLAISTGADATFIDGDLLADAKVRDALDLLDGPDSPPLVVHRAKELMHGLGRDAADRSTATPR